MAVIWTVLSTERETTNQGVIVAHWRMEDSEVVGEGADAVTHYGSSYGSLGFTPDPDAEGFTAYADLTETIVLGWVKSSLGSDQITVLENQIAAQIADSKAPATAHGVPW